MYRNSDIKAIYAFIPPGHRHVRFMVEAGEEIIVLQEATVAGLVRAYAMTALHPVNKGIVLRTERIPSPPRKQDFAEYQVLEETLGEEALKEIEARLGELGITYT